MSNATMSTSVFLTSVFLMGVASTVGSQHAEAQCVDLTPAQMFLDGSTLPEGEIGVDYIEIVLAVPGPVDFLPSPDSVVALRIAPPEMLNGVDDYVATVDYSACIDASTGAGTGDFLSDGAYTVEVEYSGGSRDLFVVKVNIKSLGKCFANGAVKEFTCPTPPKAYEGDDADDPPDFPNQSTVTSVMDLVTQVCTDAGTGMIDLVLVDHGCEGAIAVNGENVSSDAADAANLAKFCEMKGKLKSVTLLSCSTGHGQVGCDFLETLSNCFNGVPVTGYTGDVQSWNRNGTRHWGSYGEAVTKSDPPSLPHFNLTINFEVDVFGDSGPVDTVGLGIGEGPFVYEPMPAGIDLDGMITEDLPDGLALDTDTGAISGTPTTAEIRHVACILKDPETDEPWDILWWEIIIEGPGECGDGVCQPGEDCENCEPDCGPCPVCGNEICEEGEDCETCPEDCPCEEGEVCVDGQCVGDIPTVSEWGLIIMALLALTAGTIVFGRRRRPAVA